MSRRNKNVSQNGLQSTALHRTRMHDAGIRPSVGKNFKNFHRSTFLLEHDQPGTCGFWRKSNFFHAWKQILSPPTCFFLAGRRIAVVVQNPRQCQCSANTACLEPHHTHRN